MWDFCRHNGHNQSSCTPWKCKLIVKNWLWRVSMAQRTAKRIRHLDTYYVLVVSGACVQIRYGHEHTISQGWLFNHKHDDWIPLWPNNIVFQSLSFHLCPVISSCLVWCHSFFPTFCKLNPPIHYNKPLKWLSRSTSEPVRMIKSLWTHLDAKSWHYN